jgi:adenylate cyclase
MTTAPLNRRLLAILAVDVVGYSRLMDQDESGTIARLQTLRTEVISLCPSSEPRTSI